MTSAMISDETFPQELQIDDEENEIFESICTTRSVSNLASYFSAENSENSENSDNSTDINHSLVETSTIALLIKSSARDFGRLTNSERDPKCSQQQQSHPEASFKSISDSARKLMTIPPPKAPIKKRKSYSCHDLQLKKNSSNNYDHVESKVKKLIQNLAPDTRRKSFSRTKSLPACSVQAPTVDETCDDNDNSACTIDLKREIRKKTIRIYELEEKVETKESKILELQLEKADMRMTFDEFRRQIDSLKDIESKYNQMRAFSPNKSQKSVLIQTDLQDTSQEPLLPDKNLLIPRHLTFNGGEHSIHDFSLINNSTDNLIPVESEILDMSVPEEPKPSDESAATTTTTVSGGKEKKKSKKFRLFKLMQCISSKTSD